MTLLRTLELHCLLLYFLFLTLVASCNINNCKNCDQNSSDICAVCKLGFYLPTCDACPPNCDTCNSTQCFNCSLTTLRPYQNKCIPCGTNCATCNSTVCLNCTLPSQYINGFNCTDCSQDCNTCNSTHCFQCKSNTLRPQGSNCIPCGNNCQTCNNFSCESCNSSASYVDGFNCNSCPNGCATCNSTACLSCLQNTQRPSGNSCVPCGSNCVICDNFQCSLCSNISFYVEGFDCLPCSVSCLQCTATQCSLCINNTLRPQGTECIPCGNNCLNCNHFTCTQCSNLYSYVSNFDCISCQPNCLSCTAFSCNQCNSNSLRPLGQNCIPCGQNCSSCNATTCQVCSIHPSYIVGFDCFPCEDGCSQCTQFQCEDCLLNTQRPQGTQCVPCGSNCQNCNNITCLTCSVYPYYIDLFDCVECGSNCTQCDQGLCLVCSIQYYYIDGLNCVPCAQHCISCDLNSCLACDSNQLKPSDQNCVSCGINCATCDLLGCTSCSISPSKIISFDCFLCEPDCIECNQFGCLACSSNSLRASGHNCIPCGSNCLSCNSISCDICAIPPPYFIDGFECLSCGQNCSSCNASVCLTCVAQNYFIQDKKCKQCEPNCLTCTAIACLNCDSASLRPSQKNCIPCGTDCLECDMSACLRCAFEYSYVVAFDCIQCAPQCIQCNASGCLHCESTQLRPDGDTCIPCGLNCIECNKFSCLQCQNSDLYIDGYDCFKCESPMTIIGGECICPSSSSIEVGQLRFCFNNCGNGIVEGQEQCDDGNNDPFDGCLACQYDCFPSCLICLSGFCIECAYGFELTITQECVLVYQQGSSQLDRLNLEKCGDGVVTGSEQCDDANLSPFDGCFSCQDSCRLLTQDQPLVIIIGYTLECSCGEAYLQVNDLCISSCHYSCKRCSLGFSPAHCTQCDTNSQRELFQGFCRCMRNFEELPEERSCKPICFRTCSSCVKPADSSSCLTCPKARTLKNGYCRCYEGWYEDANLECIQCPYKCLECQLQNSLLNCQLCEDLRTFKANRCECQPDYFEHKQHCIRKCLPYKDCDFQWRFGVRIKNCWTNQQPIRIAGEECDDGNSEIRDGCSENIVDQGWSCENDDQNLSTCFKCSASCSKCRLMIDNTTYCLECAQGYYMLGESCRKCPLECTKCTSNTECQECVSNVAELQEKSKVQNQCQSKCGNGLLDPDEECDDGNLVNNDGCQGNCKLTKGFNCLHQVCTEKAPLVLEVEKSLDQNLNSYRLSLKTPTQQLIQLNKNCSNSQVWVDGLENSFYHFELTELENRTACNLTMSYFVDVTGNEIIHVLLFVYQGQTRMLQETEEVVEVQLQVQAQRSYSAAQISQAETIKSTQTRLAYVLLIIGPLSIILGGFETFFNILDILTWINNFYFLNVEYPLNVKVFFQYAIWGEIDFLKLPFELMSPFGEENLPKKFQERDVGFLFFLNFETSFVIIILILLVISVAKLYLWLIRKTYMQQVVVTVDANYLSVFGFHKVHEFYKKQKAAKRFQMVRTNTFSKMPLTFKSIYNYLDDRKEEFNKMIIKCLYLTYLDIGLSCFIQIFYNRGEEPLIVRINYGLAIVLLTVLLLVLVMLFKLSQQSELIFENDNFRKKFGEFYDFLNLKKQSARHFIVIDYASKLCFIFSIVFFYDQPFFQIALCHLAVGVSILVTYNNPYKVKAEFIQSIVSDVSLSIILAIATILAVNDITNCLYYHQMEILGWIILTIIAVQFLTNLYFLLLHLVEQVKSRFDSVVRMMC